MMPVYGVYDVFLEVNSTWLNFVYLQMYRQFYGCLFNCKINKKNHLQNWCIKLFLKISYVPKLILQLGTYTALSVKSWQRS